MLYRALSCYTRQYWVGHRNCCIDLDLFLLTRIAAISRSRPSANKLPASMITTATDGVSHIVLSCATLMISHRQFLEMCYINCRFSIQTWLQHRSYASSGWGPEGDWALKAGHTPVRRSCAPKPPMLHGHFHTHFVGDKLKHISKDNLINILNVC